MYAPNTRALKHMMWKLTALKRGIDKFTIIVWDFNTPLSVTDTQSRQKISKGIDSLNDTINQLDPNSIYRKLHSTTEDYAFFSSSHGIFSKIDHILGYIIQLQDEINVKTL